MSESDHQIMHSLKNLIDICSANFILLFSYFFGYTVLLRLTTNRMSISPVIPVYHHLNKLEFYENTFENNMIPYDFDV